LTSSSHSPFLKLRGMYKQYLDFFLSKLNQTVKLTSELNVIKEEQSLFALLDSSGLKMLTSDLSSVMLHVLVAVFMRSLPFN